MKAILRVAAVSGVWIAGFFLVPLAAQAANAFLAASEIGGSVGMSDKGSPVYQRLSEGVFKEFEKNAGTFLVFKQGEIPAQKLRNDFVEYCLDRDHSDIVSWNSLNERDINVSFSCVLASEHPKIHERLFVFSFRDQTLVDVRVASADIASAPALRNAESAGLNDAEKVVVAVSGAMLSSGVTAARAAKSDEAPIFSSALSSDVVKAAGMGGLAAAASAALNHFIFDMASTSKSGLSGGALTIALSEPELPATSKAQAVGDQSWIQNERRKAQSSSGRPNSFSINLTFKF